MMCSRMEAPRVEHLPCVSVPQKERCSFCVSHIFALARIEEFPPLTSYVVGALKNECLFFPLSPLYIGSAGCLVGSAGCLDPISCAPVNSYDDVHLSISADAPLFTAPHIKRSFVLFACSFVWKFSPLCLHPAEFTEQPVFSDTPSDI